MKLITCLVILLSIKFAKGQDKEINLHTLGAKGDGSNEKDILQKAMNKANGKILQIPSGVYSTGKVTISSGSDITIDGSGTVKSDAINQIGDHIFEFENISNLTIKNITLDGNIGRVPGSDKSGASLIKIWNCKNILIENVTFTNNAYIAASCVNDRNLIFRNCRFINTDVGILTQGGCDSVTIDSNYFEGGTSEGVSIWGDPKTGFDKNVTIANNIVKSKHSSSAYHLRYAENVLITKNKAVNCVNGVGTEKVSVKWVTITGNFFVNCKRGFAGDISFSRISGNTITDTHFTGIWVGKGAGAVNDTITNNAITNVNEVGLSEDGIRLTKSINCVVRNNTILDDRNSFKNYSGIRVSGQECKNNKIENNTIKGFTVLPIIVEKGAFGTIVNQTLH